MMRGTIWTMVDDVPIGLRDPDLPNAGVPIRRQVITIESATTPEEFKYQATYASGQRNGGPLECPDGGWLSFGPIGEPWGKL